MQGFSTFSKEDELKSAIVDLFVRMLCECEPGGVVSTLREFPQLKTPQTMQVNFVCPNILANICEGETGSLNIELSVALRSNQLRCRS